MQSKTLGRITGLAFLFSGLFLLIFGALMALVLGQLSSVAGGLGAALPAQFTQGMAILTAVAWLGIIGGLLSIIAAVAYFVYKYK